MKIVTFILLLAVFAPALQAANPPAHPKFIESVDFMAAFSKNCKRNDPVFAGSTRPARRNSAHRPFCWSGHLVEVFAQTASGNRVIVFFIQDPRVQDIALHWSSAAYRGPGTSLRLATNVADVCRGSKYAAEDPNHVWFCVSGILLTFADVAAVHPNTYGILGAFRFLGDTRSDSVAPKKEEPRLRVPALIWPINAKLPHGSGNFLVVGKKQTARIESRWKSGDLIEVIQFDGYCPATSPYLFKNISQADSAVCARWRWIR